MLYDFESHEIPRVALLFATLFAALSNADYIAQMWKGKLDTMGSPLAHVGFALTILERSFPQPKKTSSPKTALATSPR